MLKWLVISGVILLGLPIHGQEKTSPPNTPQKPSNNEQKTSQDQRSSPDKHPTSYLSRLLSPENVPNIGLFFVGIIGSGIALSTLFKIERQTKAGEDAAKAALLSAQAVINAERPWLLVMIESGEGPMGGFNIFVKNKGRTPAMITAAYMGCVRVKDISHLPKEPPYKTGSMVQNLIVIPDEKPLIWWFDGRMLNRMLGEDARIPSWEGQTFVFGKILYRDLADPISDRIHETR